MGASHSGKHQLGPAAGQQQQQQKVGEVNINNGNSKFGHSFRKGMGNMLLNPTSSSIKSTSSQGKSKQTRPNANAIDTSSGKINTSHQLTGVAPLAAKENIHDNQYYVPSSSSASHTVHKLVSAQSNRQPSSAMMNNYVTMQQQSISNSMASNAKGRMQLALDENGNNGFVVSSGTTTHFSGPVYGATSSTTTTNSPNKPIEMDSVHDYHHNRARSNNSDSAHDQSQNSPAMAHRNYQQQQFHHHQASKNSPTIQQQQQPSFHLARAINTKTTSHVLNHNVSMSSDCNSSSSASSGGSVAMQNCGRRLQKHRHNQQQQQQQQQPVVGQISSPAITRAIQQQQHYNNNPAMANHHQLTARAATNNECCLPNSPYQLSPAAGATFVSSPHQQHPQQQWRHQRYVADPASSSSLYSTYDNDERYLPPADDCNSSAASRQQVYYPRNHGVSSNHDQQPQDQTGHYKLVQQQQFATDNNNPYSSHMFQPMSPAGQLPIHYNRSYSFGSSLTLDSKKIRSQNPLASLFQPLSTQLSSTPTSSNKSKQQYANTIQVTRRNKSGQLAAGPADSTTTSNGRSAPGSLKRVKSSLLSAQQASYEAMRTIDMYLIRQIARSCMDSDMEQKIELEIRLRELAAQSILEARNEIDVLEVEKSLLTSDQRMNFYASHLELQRKKLSNPSLSTIDSGRGSKTDNHNHTTTTVNKRTGSGGQNRTRSDVVGAPVGSTSTNGDTSSPSFSSLSNSQSPSKLSPVSGQSAATDESQASFTSRSHHSRTGLRHSQSSSSAVANNLSARIRAKSKRREQLIQNLAKQNNLDCSSVMDSRASVSVSEIRIPLMWRDVDHFKNQGDYKRYAVFCLLKIDSQIYDTQLITDVDRQVTDVTFDDFIVFNNIDYDFELTLEVYSCVYLEQFSFSSTPRKLKEKLTSSIGRAMGKRLATQTASSSYTKELQAYDKSYRFALIASANLQLEDSSNSVKTYDLVLMSPSAHNRHHQPTTPTTMSRSYHNNSSQDQYGRNTTNSMSGQHNNSSSQLTSANTSKNANKNTLPLFGHFCCRLFVRPDVFDKNMNSALI